MVGATDVDEAGAKTSFADATAVDDGGGKTSVSDDRSSASSASAASLAALARRLSCSIEDLME